MKILYVITGLTKGGAELQLFNLAKELKKDFDISVISFHGEHYAKLLTKEGIKVKTLGIKSKFNVMKGISEIKKEIEKQKPDIVHSFLPHANIIVKIAKLLVRHKFKLICSIRAKEIIDLHHNIGERLLDFSCDKITTNSHTTKKALYQNWFFRKNKIKVIYNGLAFRKPRKKKEILPGKKKILTVANFKDQKDYPTNVKTCEELMKKRTDFVFLYVGEGQVMKKMKNMVKKKQLKGFVKFLGSSDYVPELLKSSDVFFLPTLYEGQSNAIIEAMHYKCPIVTTNIPENREIIDNKKEGLLIKIKSPKKMAFAIDEILKNKSLRESLVKNAFKKSKIFNLKKMAEKYNQIYSELKCAE